ncbi:MAG TPA: carbonic anhydrase [Gemmatimonadales bacterium]|nr:carbonic anhydrase [Gemmatimonadales bacterium]
MPSVSATDALDRLRQGNARFVSNVGGVDSSHDRRAELVNGQEPFAIILGCSDSRAPAEFVFDQGLGDLFVIRVAGNIIAPSLVGSVEFAAEAFSTKLVVVMGHTQCGAVTATIEQLRRSSGPVSPNLQDIVDRVRPAVETIVRTRPDLNGDALMREAVRANIRASVEQLRHGSRLLEGLIKKDGLMVVGAEYALETGVVEFFA